MLVVVVAGRVVGARVRVLARARPWGSSPMVVGAWFVSRCCDMIILMTDSSCCRLAGGRQHNGQNRLTSGGSPAASALSLTFLAERRGRCRSGGAGAACLLWVDTQSRVRDTRSGREARRCEAFPRKRRDVAGVLPLRLSRLALPGFGDDKSAAAR